MLRFVLVAASAVLVSAQPAPADVELNPVQCVVGGALTDCDLIPVNSEGYLLDPLEDPTCAHYNGEYSRPGKLHGTMAMATFFAVIMAFGIGANDAANQWGTPVGSGAISIQKAVMLGGFMEFLGAWMLGYGVSKTVQKGVAKLADEDCWACGYCDSRESVYMQGMMGALVGASLLLLVASRYAIPLSTTHAIVGGVVGMTIAMSGSKCLTWKHPEKGVKKGLAGIVLSWVISPVVAGLIGAGSYYLGDFLIFRAAEPLARAKLLVPVMYGIATSVMAMLCIFKTKPLKALELAPKFIFIIGAIVWVAVTALAWVIIGIYNRVEKLEEIIESASNTPQDAPTDPATAVEADPATTEAPKGAVTAVPDTTGKGADIEMSYNPNEDDKTNEWYDISEVKITAESSKLDRIVGWAQAKKLYSSALDSVSIAEQTDLVTYTPAQQDAVEVFKYCLVWMSCLESFAHGANDTGNSTAAFTAVYLSYKGDQHTCAPPESPGWIMALGGLGVWAGIVCFGSGVIKTIGTRVTKVDYFRAFCIEFASAMSVVIATALEFPVSTTHCQIGALFFVGLASAGPKGVSFSLLGLIFLSWVLTLPSSGLVAAAVAGIASKVI